MKTQASRQCLITVVAALVAILPALEAGAQADWWGYKKEGDTSWTRADSIEAGLGGYGEIDYVPFLTNTYHAPWVEVVSPNGGEVLADTSNITWVAPDVEDDSVSIDIYYSDDGGALSGL